MDNKQFKIASCMTLLAASVAHAQVSQYIRPAYQFPEPILASNGPASVQVADTPLFFTPYLAGAVGHDSNLFYSNLNRRSSSLYMVSPGVRFDARDPNKVFQLAYQGQSAVYTSSRDDDYFDNTIRAQFDVALDRHNFVRLGFDYLRLHDPRGSTDRPIAGSPDKYRQTNPFVIYALGAPGAQGRVELYYSDPNRRYLNNRDVTASSDRDMQEYGGAFYWRVMPRTYAMAEVRETNIRYDVPNSPFNADERRYYAGVQWEAAAATTGTIKVGRLKRDFDSSQSADYSGAAWEGILSWAPRSYSRFDAYTVRQTSESTGLGNFILTTASGIDWTHSWTTYFTTDVGARYQRDQYQGFDRSDRTLGLTLRAGYKFRRWLTLGAEFSRTKRDSNLDQFDYDRNFFVVTATASM